MRKKILINNSKMDFIRSQLDKKKYLENAILKISYLLSSMLVD